MAEPYERLITEFTVLQNDQTASPTSFNGFIPRKSNYSWLSGSAQ